MRPRVLEDEVDGEAVREHDEFLMQQQLELEAFYSIGKELSAFLQGSAILEQDLLGRTFESVSDRYWSAARCGSTARTCSARV